MTPTPPGIRPIELGELAVGYAGDLGVDEQVEQLRLENLDLEDAVLTGLEVRESELDGVGLSGADLRRSRFVEVVLRTNSPILSAPISGWRDVHVRDSRIGSGDLYEGSWERVRFSNCKIGYLNLRGSKLTDVEFVDCSIDELDLLDATVARMRILDSAIGSLDVTRARLTDVDLRGAELRGITGSDGLRGATITELQLAELSGILAAQLGIIVAD